MPGLRTVALIAFALASAASTGRAAPVASAFGARVACAAQDGVQFCAGDVTTRVESFDGVPLDVNLTLPPASMDGPFPLVVDLHGWSQAKTDGPYVDWAMRGWAVLSYSARGFGESCGSEASRAPDVGLTHPTACTDRGWIHLADARFEGHDTQWLAGRLVDEGLVVPTRIGVTGASYGGGQSMILAALKDRTMQVDGTLGPWTSPNGTPMTLAGAAPLMPWSDLAYALTPTGRTLDYRAANPYARRGGIQKQSWNDVLYTVGGLTGFYAPPGVDPGADIRGWNDRVGAGEPYDGDSALTAILDELTSHHSAYYVDDAEPPAPLFIYNAWTDDLFPVDEALRFWRKTRGKWPTADLTLLFADDFGHPRARLATGSAGVMHRVTDFFARTLDGEGGPPPRFTTYTQACNGSSVEGAFTAEGWDDLHPGEVRYASRKTRRFDSRGGSAANEAADDPLGGGPCRTVKADDDPRAATWRLPAASGDGYTLLGSPTVLAVLATTSPAAQIAARLWDVAPDGMQTLVAHGLYRPRSDDRGVQPFQLHPNGWHFAAGHVPKLELLGRSAPYGRPSNGTFVVTVASLELRLPVRERPDGRTVRPPAPPALPSDADEPVGCPLAPRDDCRLATGKGAAALAIVAAPRAARDRLAWKWRGIGRAGFEDPTTSEYALCVYDGGHRLVATAVASGAARCGKASCWRRTRTGFAWNARGSTDVGVRAVSLGPAAARLSAAGPHVGVPTLPVAATLVASPQPSPPLTAQLVRRDGGCWSATLTRLRRSTARALRAASE